MATASTAERKSQALERFLEKYRDLMREGLAHDFLCAPVLEGVPYELFYQDRKRVGPKDDLANVPSTLKINATSLSAAAASGKVIISGRKIGDQFIAQSWRTRTTTWQVAPILRTQMLEASKFTTPLRLMSWWRVVGADKKGAVLRPLSRDRDEVIEQYAERVRLLSLVLKGKRQSYWSKEPGSSELPFNKILGLQIVWASKEQSK